MDDTKLRTVWQQKRGNYRTINISEPLAIFMNHKLAKQVHDFGDISTAWEGVLSEEMREHAKLKSYHQGTLTVAVKSAAKRFQLQTFLSGEGLKRLRREASRAINKVKVMPA